MKIMEESQITHHASGGISFVGPDAINLYRAAVLVGALRLYAKCKLLPNRHVTATDLLTMATGYTGKHYPRGYHDSAAVDVNFWIGIMNGEIPTVIVGDEGDERIV